MSTSNKKPSAKSSAISTRLSSGPSSFPRRAPLPATAGAVPQKQQQQQKRQASTSTPADSEISGGMARRLTRFYTANFERRPVITLCITNCILSTVGDAAAQIIPMLTSDGAMTAIGWDFERSLRFATFGFSLGPLIEKWNRFLELRFPLRPTAQVFHNPPSPFDDGPAFAEKLRQEAEKEGFRVNIDRGDSQQGQQYASKSSKHIVDPQRVAMPSAAGQPGQISVSALLKRVFADQFLFAPLGLALFLVSMAVLEGLDLEGVMDRLNKLYLPILLINWQIWPFVQIINFRYLPLRYRVPFSSSLGILWTVFLSFRNAKASAPKVAA